MSDLAYYQTRILETLGDAAGARYDTATINLGLRTALARYSLVSPEIIKEEFTFTADGRDHTLSLAGISGSANGLVDVLEVNYPFTTGQENPTAVSGFHQYFTSGSPAIHISEDPPPDTDDKIQLTYSVTHTIKDLDSATTSTIKPHHIYGIIQGAAAYAALTRSGQVSEAFGSRASDTEKLSEWATAQIVMFETFLLFCAKEQAQILGRLPQLTWTLDEWDDQ